MLQSWPIKTSCIICITVTIIVQLCPWSYNLKARAKVIYIYPPHTTPKYQICTGSIFTAAQIYPKNKFTRKQVWGDTWSRDGGQIYIYPLHRTPKDQIYIFTATQTKARVRRYLEPGRRPATKAAAGQSILDRSQLAANTFTVSYAFSLVAKFSWTEDLRQSQASEKGSRWNTKSQ